MSVLASYQGVSVSLLEILTTIALISILLLASNSRGSAEQEVSVLSVSKEITRLMEKHSLDALLRSAKSTIEFDIARQRLLSETQRTILSLPHSVRLTSARFGHGSTAFAEVKYHPSGIASPGSVSLESNSGKSCRVIQSLRGAVRYECS